MKDNESGKFSKCIDEKCGSAADIRIYTNTESIRSGEKDDSLKKFSSDTAESVIRFHKIFPQYEKTPLVRLNALSSHLGVKEILVKDESRRYGLNAFKVLGGSYAAGCIIAEKLGISIEDMTYETIHDERTRKITENMTFVTATDGNHGRGIAWAASVFGAGCVVYMPKGSSAERLSAIRELGADASVTDLSYDDCVRKAAKDAEDKGWILIQDTAFTGYEKIPELIMKGYTTIALEIYEEIKGLKLKPTHIFLQAGVGSFAGAMAAFFSDIYGKNRPEIITVEPLKADCLLRTAEASDGKLHKVSEDMDTIMAGLACGEPSPMGWEILSRFSDHFAAVPDEIAAEGMRVLSSPVGDDKRVISGESGAAPFGFIYVLMKDEGFSDIREKFGIDKESVLMFISTEGDTDEENYRRIVWDGAYPV